MTGVVAESDLHEAARTGDVLDAAYAGGRRHLDAALLRRFLVRPPDDVDPRGLRLRNAIVDGPLDLTGITLAFPIWCESTEFTAAIQLGGASLDQLALTGDTQLPALYADGMTVRRDVDLSGSRIGASHQPDPEPPILAAVQLCDAVVGGGLRCAGTVLEPAGTVAIQADRLRLGGAMALVQGFRARGGIMLEGARIDGALDLRGVDIESDSVAVNLIGATIAAQLLIGRDETGRRPVIRGTIDMSHARIGREIRISDAEITAAVTVPAGVDTVRAITANAITGPGVAAGAGLIIDGETFIGGTVALSTSDIRGLQVGARCAISAPGGLAVDLGNAQVRSNLVLSQGVNVQGTLRLVGTHIHGSLHLRGVTLSQPEGPSLIRADGITVDGEVDLSGLRAAGGRLKFWRASIGGGFDATGVQLSNPSGSTLRLHQSTVGGSVRLVDGFSSNGYVLLNRTTVEGRLDCTDGSFTCLQASEFNPSAHAIQAVAMNVRGGMLLGWNSVAPSVDFTDAFTTVLQDDPAHWPTQFVIAGFRYDRFDTPSNSPSRNAWDWRRRRTWLLGQATYDAGPYEQAARVFRRHGYPHEAEQLLIAQRTGARRATGRWSSPRYVLNAVYGWSVAYGYRPGRVLWLLVLLLVLLSTSLGTAPAQATLRATDEAGDVYATTGIIYYFGGVPAPADLTKDPCGNGQVRCFDPVLYAIDTVVPLVSLGQRSTWYPTPSAPWGVVMQWWLNIATLIGWLLSSIFVLSFTRIARSL